MAQQGSEVVQGFIDTCVNGQDVDRTPEYWNEDALWHGTAFGEVVGRDAFEDAVREFLTGFPDLHLGVEDALDDGDRVAARMRITGTHEGEFFGLAPSGKKVEFEAIATFRLADGKISEEWFSADVYGLQRQIAGESSPLLPGA